MSEMWRRCEAQVDAPRLRPATTVLSGPVPTREDPGPEPVRRPVGFATPAAEADPLLWQGDQA
ncbi:MAG: hypothetical protein ACRDYZ_00775 [Acidimicrobiales bacterium]